MSQNPVLDTLLPASSFAVASITPQQICGWVTFWVARDFAIDAAYLFAPTRGAPRVAFARQISMYLAHVGFALSFEAVGRVFGRDRTTVAHACRVVEDSRDDIWLDGRLTTLEHICHEGPHAGHGAAFVSRNAKR